MLITYKMSKTLIIHTENKSKLYNLFQNIERLDIRKDLELFLYSKGYSPWEDEELRKHIISFKTYNAYITQKSKIDSIIDTVFRVKTEDVLIVDEEIDEIREDNFSFININKNEFLKLNLDTKYQSIKWFIIDLLSQQTKKEINISDDTNDCLRYKEKLKSTTFFEKIIYVDGGLGDHVMALPFLEKFQNEIHICCKYPFMYEHLNIKGFIHWNDPLFGGYSRFVYEYGSKNNSNTIIDAFFEMHGYNRDNEDVLVYNGIRLPNNDINSFGKKIALICTSAAKIQGFDSNKDWKDVRWLKLVNELKKRDYYVIQVGTSKDNQIPTVDLKFLDKPIPNIAGLIESSSIWISVDTFFHHFASSIKPEVGICLTPFYNDHAKHPGVTYIEKDCGKNYWDRRWWMDLQQPERKECMDLIQVEDVLKTFKKKILIATLYFKNQGGSDLYVFELAKEFVRMGHDVSVIARYLDEDFTKMAEKNGIKILSLEHPPCYEYGKNPEDKHLIFKNCDVDYDIIHLNQNWVSDYICQLYPEVKKVSTIHSAIYSPEDPFIHESIKKYICVTPDVKKYVVDKFNVDEEKTRLIYNPINIDKFKNKNNSDKNYILFVGNLNYLRKNTLFDLVERAKNENKELWIIGKKDESFIDDLLKNNNVRYHEYSNDIEELIRNSSYTASLYFGRAMIESFICDKDCLVYDVNEYGDILSAQMLKPFENMEKFYSNNVAKEIMDVYNEIL